MDEFPDEHLDIDRDGVGANADYNDDDAQSKPSKITATLTSLTFVTFAVDGERLHMFSM